jgi:hypothetical protein
VVLLIIEHKQYPLKHFNGSRHDGLLGPHVSLNALTNRLSININRLNMNNSMIYDIEYE